MKRLGEGYIEDVQTSQKCLIRWAGSWSSDKGYGDKDIGCFISFQDMPKLHLTMHGVYRIKFKSRKTKEFNYNHSLDMICKLWGTDYIEDHKTKKCNHHLKFLRVDPLTACDMIHKRVNDV